MANIVVITFEDETEACKAREALRKVHKEGHLELVDMVTVAKSTEGKIKVKHALDQDALVGAVFGSLIGFLIAGIFFPITGIVLGAIGGGVLGKMNGNGVDRRFINEVSDSLKPGNSAIFIVIKDLFLSDLIVTLKPFQGKIYHTSLPKETEDVLGDILSQRIGQIDSQLIALGFEGQTTADEMIDQALDWQARGMVNLDDVVVASRGQDNKVKIRQTKTQTAKTALKGGGIGLLAGILLGGPVGGLVVGAAAGAIAGKAKDIGIDDHIIKEVSDELRPDTSILFLLGNSPDPQRFFKELHTLDASIVTTSLSAEQRENLKKLLESESS